MKIFILHNPKGGDSQDYCWLADTQQRELAAFMRAFEVFDTDQWFGYLSHVEGHSYEEKIQEIEREIGACAKALKTIEPALLGTIGRQKMNLENRLDAEKRDRELFQLCELARKGDQIAAREVMKTGITGHASWEIVEAADPVRP